MIAPGAMLGVLGGGQLGRMFAMAAHTLGYRVTVLDPDPHSPAAHSADRHLCAAYDDPEALAELGRTCAAVTVEFENVATSSLERLARGRCTVRPDAHAVSIAQDRIAEKSFLQKHGFPIAPFIVLSNAGDLDADFQFPAILKRSRLGYDGKGQAQVSNPTQLASAWHAFNNAPCVLEQCLPLQQEVSVILARSADGDTACYPVVENRHAGGILDVSIAPARISPALAQQATEMAASLAERLNYCGVLAVEFFVLQGDKLIINEFAPRPHNSGHYTLNACVTSQFEQQVRALCGLPLGDARLVSPAVMVNLLGELWQQGEPRWETVLQHPQIKLHLYGKETPRAGRKMGHYTCVDASAEAALAVAMQVQAQLQAAATGSSQAQARA